MIFSRFVEQICSHISGEDEAILVISLKPPAATVFIVSQRAASIRYADVILVMEDGEIAGMGTHDELMESCSVYKEIYDSQFKKEGRVS